ncbi:Di-copper centre-containing protein [Ramaria rubella]|nr:Di-copper centre-containing protein [Ramaria rubella]
MRGLLTIGLLFAAMIVLHTCGHGLASRWSRGTVLNYNWSWLSPQNSEAISKPPGELETGSHSALKICSNPRIRPEWRTLTSQQKKAWISAVKCLGEIRSLGKEYSPVSETYSATLNPPYNKSGSLYDDFSYVHMQLNDQIHQTGLFLPWHRYFLWSFESSLRLHCKYTGPMPYWNWTRDAEDFEHASIFSDPDPNASLGGFGHPAHDAVLLDGAFARMPLTYPAPHTLRREYTPYPFLNLTTRLYPNQTFFAADAFKAGEVLKMINAFKGDYKGFQSYIEGMQGAHMSLHLIIGGDLGGTCPQSSTSLCGADAKCSPNEPLFWLHHGMVDKIWSHWQQTHTENFWAFEGGVVRDLDTWPRYTNGAPPPMSLDYKLPNNGMLIGNFTIRDIFNTTSNEPLCYIYR